MIVIGTRCSNSDYTFCILSGNRDSPIVEETNRVSFPKDYSEPELLNWFYQEVTALFQRTDSDAVVIKKAEGMVKRSNVLETRIQCGAIISLASAQAGCQKED